jgi:AcrR family transcriptional regulator
MTEDPKRSRYVEAGMELLVEDGIQILNRGLNLERVAEQAGTSSGNYYRHFPRSADGKAKFIDELIIALAGSPAPVADQLSDVIANSLTAAEGDPRQVIRDVCRWDFTTIREDPSFVRALAATVLGRKHKKAISTLRGLYREYDQLIVSGVDVVLSTWGGSLRKPFTLEKLALSLTAIVEGLTLRWLACPEDVPEDLFGDIVVAIVGAVFDVEQGHEHIDDVAAPLATAVMSQFQMAQRESIPDQPGKLIVDAARRHFEERGYFATTLAHISSGSGVSLEDLKRLFPNKADIVIRALRRPFEELQERVEEDIVLRRDEVAAVRQYLRGLADFARQDHVMTEALLALVAHDTVQSPETATRVKEELDLPGLVTPIIAAGQEKGLFVDILPPGELAAIMTNTLLLRSFTRPEQDAEEVATTISSVLLDGIEKHPA